MINPESQMCDARQTSLWFDVVDSEEVDHSRCEVQSDVLLVLLDGQTMSVPIAGSGHPAAVQQHWRPEKQGKKCSLSVP